MPNGINRMFSKQQTLNDIELEESTTDHNNLSNHTTIQNQKARKDILQGIKKWRIWLTLAYQDIKLRYRRSVLGPLWLTISMAISLYSMGYLYSNLFHVDLQDYYPYLVTGMLGWTLVSTLVVEYTDGLVSYQSLIKQICLPYTLHIHRIAARNIIIFFHNFLVLIPIYIIFHKNISFNWHTLLIIPGLAIIYLNSISFGMILAMIGARYRDMSQFIKSIIQVIFFITPVMWKPDMLVGKKHLIVDLNPFYSILELIREPLLGKMPDVINILICMILTLVGFIVMFGLMSRYRARIIYWL